MFQCNYSKRCCNFNAPERSFAESSGSGAFHFLRNFAIAWKETTPGKLASMNSIPHSPQHLTFTSPDNNCCVRGHRAKGRPAIASCP